MPKVIYIEFNGKKHEVDVPNGYSIMEGAVKNSVNGIDADCGGSCACATCHIYIDDKWVERLPKIEEAERDMLDFVSSPKKESRLSCQIMMNDQLDGLIVKLPDRQG